MSRAGIAKVYFLERSTLGQNFSLGPSFISISTPCNCAFASAETCRSNNRSSLVRSADTEQPNACRRSACQISYDCKGCGAKVVHLRHYRREPQTIRQRLLRILLLRIGTVSTCAAGSRSIMLLIRKVFLPDLISFGDTTPLRRRREACPQRTYTAKRGLRHLSGRRARQRGSTTVCRARPGLPPAQGLGRLPAPAASKVKDAALAARHGCQ